MILVWVLILIIALIVLVKGADWFTEGAESIGLRMGIPPFVVGITIVSIGTSLPELASSIMAVLKNNSDIVLANVVGSNIANILFVLGLGAVVAGVKTQRDITKFDIPILLGSTILLLIFAWDGVFSRIEAIIFILLTILYVRHEFSREKIAVEEHYYGPRALYALIGGFVLVVAGAKFLIDAVIELSVAAGISTAVIGATVVAFGTSIPEAVVTVVAVLKKQREIALGNIVGSNVFNVLLISGLAGVIGPLTVSSIVVQIGIPLLLGITVLLGIFMRDKKLSKTEGILFLAMYVVFVMVLLL